MSTFIDLLRKHKEALEHQYSHQLSQAMRAAIQAMLQCKTEQQGRSQWFCAHCHHDDRLPLSCGHRHCPQCQHRTTSDWLLRQKQKPLPVPYFMVTFTLPAQLRALAYSQPKVLYHIMFSVASSVLKSFAQREHQGEIGFTTVLHTRSRQRNLHPHLHIIVAGGRYEASKQVWHKSHPRYLFNAMALAKVWRARMLTAIRQHPQLWLPASIPNQWVVDCRCVGRGQPALEYLSRYLYRGVLPDKDIIHIEENSVTFRYQDNQTQQWQKRTLPTLKFLMLILQHVLPKGLQRVRDYGFLRGQNRQTLIRIQLLLLRLFCTPMALEPTTKSKATRLCPCCQHEMMCVGITRPR